MRERVDNKMSKNNIEAVNQMILGKRRMKEIAPLVGSTLHIVNEPLFYLGNETEPYTEKSIDALIAQEWGISPRRKNT